MCADMKIVVVVLSLVVACSDKRTEATVLGQWSRCADSRRTARWETYRACFQPGVVIKQPGAVVEDLTLDQAIAEEQRTDAMSPVFVLQADNTIVSIEKGTRSVRAELVRFGPDGRISWLTHYFDAAMLAPADAPPLVYASVIGVGTIEEQQNEVVVSKLLDAYAEVDTHLPDDAVWFEPWFARALGKSEFRRHVETLKQGLEILDVMVTSTSFGGDFVVARGAIEGEHFAAVPALGIEAPKHGRHHFSIPALVLVRLGGGRVKAVTWFWQTATLYAQLDSTARTAPLQAPP